MSQELFWLCATLAMTAMCWLPYVLNRMLVLGVMGAMRNPTSQDAPLAPWAQRAQRAHANAVENLAVFAPAVLALTWAQRTDAFTASACAIYFVARLAHFAVYTAGVPVVRTLAFAVGWGATCALIGRLLGWW